MELYVKNEDDSSYSKVEFTSVEEAYADGFGNYRMAYTVQLEAGKTYVLTATQAIYLGFYGYTYTTYIASSDAEDEEDEVPDISYQLTNDGVNTMINYRYKDTILADNTFVEVTNMANAYQGNTTINIDNVDYSYFLRLYTEDVISFATYSNSTYLKIVPKTSGTITFVVDSSDATLYEYTEGGYSPVTTTAKNVTNGVTVKAHLEEGKTYLLTATTNSYSADQTKFYGYTYKADAE
jgi:hypothetical protein